MAVAQQYHQNLVHFLRKEVNYNDPGVATGIVMGRLPAGAQVTQALTRVKTTFNAATTNVLTVGTNASAYDNIFGAGDIAEGSAGNNAAPAANLQEAASEADVFVKYTQTGSAATQGKAIIHIAYTVNNG
ncbi:MAG TPA: hypothetical protein VG742_15930 [Dongiaceae bacterium]|nr:hypothetical protein [Dongiaceae bacterium]